MLNLFKKNEDFKLLAARHTARCYAQIGELKIIVEEQRRMIIELAAEHFRYTGTHEVLERVEAKLARIWPKDEVC